MDQRRGGECTETVQAGVALFVALVAVGIACLGFLCRFGFADNLAPPVDEIRRAELVLAVFLVGRWSCCSGPTAIAAAGARGPVM